MADFCKVCAKEVFGSGAEPDIKLEEIFSGLKENYYVPILCEGCGMNAVMKKDGKMKIHFVDEPVDLWHDYNDDIVFEKYALRGIE